MSIQIFQFISPFPFPLGNHFFFNSISVLNTGLLVTFSFLDSICKLKHMLFVFLSMTYFTQYGNL